MCEVSDWVLEDKVSQCHVHLYCFKHVKLLTQYSGQELEQVQ